MKNSNRKKCLVLGVVLVLYLISFSTFFDKGLNVKDPIIPNSSDPEITIVSPMNTTYNEPMSGYYPATYGFENEFDGGFPKGWIDESTGASSEVSVASEIAGHKKVLSYSSALTGEFAQTKTNLKTPQTTGSIEYYVYKNSGNKGFEISLRNSTDGYALRIGIDYQNDGQFWWRTSGSIAGEFGAGKYLDNTWFHIRIDFDIISKKFDIYINGTKEVNEQDMFYDIGSLTSIWFYQTGSLSGHWYLDALSFSWDQDYDIGDNLFEGLLLSFENATQLDWIGYSLDNQVNTSILGDIAFPFPTLGRHSIQVFGNNSLGTIYQSNIVHFTTSNYSINLITPENRTYTGSMDGYYLETYDFDDEIDGTINDDINFIDSNSSDSESFFEIIPDFNGHKKVLKCVDGTGTSSLYGIHNFTQTRSSGIIEFWYAIDNVDSTNGMALRFYGDGVHAFYINCYHGSFRSNGWIDIGQAIPNKWYHIKMVYDCSLDTVDYFIDDEFKRTAAFGTACNQIEILQIDSNAGDSSSFNAYIDAYGHLWDENGYYPATYGFENDQINTHPEGFMVWEGGGVVQVRDSIGSHKNVVQIYDTSASDYTGIHNIFDSDHTSGTIEVFVRFSHTNKHHEFSIRDGTWADSIAFSFIDGYLYYYTGGGWVYTGANFIANKWYHIKIEFNCSDAWYLWIDDTRIDRGNGFEFNGNPIAMDRIYIITHNSDANYNYFLDALGYSWDENYFIGENQHEGLLISYKTNKDLEWVGYSLDNQANITIKGNKVIPMPRNGTYSIQVFGNDSLGDIFYSEKRHFTAHYKSVEIVTPENINYTAPMSGYFPGTYGFENDQDGDVPEGWTMQTAIGCKVEVIDEIYGHNKVVELYDHSSSNIALMENIILSQSVGTIEFWIATDNAGQGTYISFMDATEHTAFKVEIKSNLIKFLYQGFNYLEDIIYNDQWHHVQIDFDCNAHEMSYWLDGIKKNEAPLHFYQDIDNIEKVWANTEGAGTGYSSYIDAIGYSWDPSYYAGDNRKEGILFSYYDYNYDFAWRQFSLDSQPRQMILGNKTLPVPEDGKHSIQFFGENYLGDYYESELRVFTIEIAPSVEWIYPANGSTVILPYSKAPYENDGLFTFQKTSRLVEDIELEINGTNLGSVWNMTSIVLTPYTAYIDGFLSATLIGKNGSMILDTDTRSFKFVKVTHEYTQILNSSTQVIGKQLYLILHDPHGDNSFSSISESTSLSIGVGSQITNAMGVSVEVGAEFSLFGVDAGASFLLEYKETLTEDYDFRYEIKDTTSLTSAQVTNDADYIGPGYGDRYWGESWIYKWVLNGTHRIYSNGTERWEKPELYYGILRGVETLASDEHAPIEWKNQNAIYNDSIPVSWITPFYESGGAPYEFENEVTTTTTRTTTFQIDLGADFEEKFGPLETHATIELSLKNYAESETSNIYKAAYHIEDDDPTDRLVQWIGIDEKFGTYIFEGDQFFCETSYPLEHNTYDYLPPEIDFPTITFDTNGDNIGPGNDDSPLVRVNIFEEGGLQTVFINYSIDNGLNWSVIPLDEIITSPGIWEGEIPPHTQGTKVQWYIIAVDNQGNMVERKDIYGNPFEYTVVNKPSVPSYSPILIFIALLIPIASILLRYRKKKIIK